WACEARGDLEHRSRGVLAGQSPVPGSAVRVVVGHGQNVTAARADGDDGGRFLRGCSRLIRRILDLHIEGGLNVLAVLLLEGVQARQLRLAAVVARVPLGEDFDAAGTAETGVEGLLQPGAADDVAGDDPALGLLDVRGAGRSGRAEGGLRESAGAGQRLTVFGEEDAGQVVDAVLDVFIVVLTQGHDGHEL